MKIRRGLAASALTTAAMIAFGASGAQAWTWASSSNPIVMTGGAGYGNANYRTYESGLLQSWLRDTQADGQLVYVHGSGSAGPRDKISFESGRRSDGEAAYARMADKIFYSAYPKGVTSYTYIIELCRDKPFALDPCSDAKRGPSGL